ncbi:MULTISPECIES: metallopeptidase family protein [Bosea]|uniref:metallopeptidase family protein n=1 Tax=Bosea TaxID=85413 RepID=UPI00215027DD|nr:MULTISPECIES: metallopeptidase family protein [Bosea]MCR4520194.1 metallopeptidase family protein [Bosea sp. 47.2.35]MDR6829760.1 putative Zn-dependent protease with MMP-like domain [Bosea robiniae]MDR6896643.1 putative Zn-dependent protease with MMP-like domain [Bosea sp. BE109]MDR7140041.1 putative Zn-dependent protease with MMP-like domain [Bosea sp. BE168]MDR7176645.1 putative Zn-dependent protease with MMP-like domain [Bosea sp. BE271]
MGKTVDARVTTTAEIDWDGVKAPSQAAFEVLAQAAFDRLPEEFRALCSDVIFNVTEFPEDDVLKELEAESPFDLLGLFSGIGLPQQGYAPQTGQMPNTIHLYRRPILDYWAEHDESLGSIVTHVMVHEIGHHFGFSDEDMEAIEAAAER